MTELVVIGLLGATLDQGMGSGRWNNWRPTVALCQQEDLLISRMDLIYQRRFTRLADQVTKDIASVSPETEVVLHGLEFENPWDFEEVYGQLHDFAKAYPFEPDEKEYLVHITTGTHVAQICLFLLTESRYFPAALIQTSPPKGKDRSQPGSYSIIDLDLSKYDRLAMRFAQEAEDDISFLKYGIETRNHAFNSLIERIERVAVRTNDPILLMGPTGAGKSRLARRIYGLRQAKQRLKGPFIEVNCATIRGDAAMSALFGHRKGAFTGAVQDRKGLLCEADGGMLFLDEVGELGWDEQAMLLRAIEEKRFLPVGSDKETGSDFQLICGTNRDLQAEVARGRYREDLLARINLWTFHMPGLADRPEDIEPNLQYELDRFAERQGRRTTFNKEARNGFLKFATSPDALWSANFRDLSGAVTRMATMAPGGRITVDVMKEETERLRRAWQRTGSGPDDNIVAQVMGQETASQLDLFDRAQLAEVLRVCQKSNSLSQAGRALFSVSREKKKMRNDADRLRKYLSRFDLTWEIIKGNS